jgi:hypothetical protein
MPCLAGFAPVIPTPELRDIKGLVLAKLLWTPAILAAVMGRDRQLAASFGPSTRSLRSLTIGGLTHGCETPADHGRLMLLFDGYKVLSIFAVTWGWVAVLPFLSLA